MYRTQFMIVGDPVNFDHSEETGITGDLNDHFIRRAVEWELNAAWEEGLICDRWDYERAQVAVWRDDVFVGVFTMDAEEVCPEWRNLKRVVDAETPGAA